MFASILDSLLTAIIKTASEKNMKNDPEFVKFMEKSNNDIKELENDYKETLKKLKNIK